MNVTQDLSFLSLITNASVVVQLVLLTLLLASGLSWYFIFGKMFAIRAAIREADSFENAFWSGSDINNLYQRSSSGRTPVVGMEKIFEAGYREFLKLKRQGRMDIGVVMDGTRRAMRAACQRELDALEQHLAFLASVGSVSPYIGLFGTVWGIMHALQDISKSGSAGLDVVAAPIGEALIATALGIATAIPAVLAYNYGLRRTRLYVAEMEDFATDFLHLAMKSGFRVE